MYVDPSTEIQVVRAIELVAILGYELRFIAHDFFILQVETGRRVSA